MGGGDVLMAAETGSGKTGAFCLPVLQIVWETLKDLESGKMSSSSSGHHQPCMFLLIFVTNCFVFFLFNSDSIFIYSCTLGIKFVW